MYCIPKFTKEDYKRNDVLTLDCGRNQFLLLNGDDFYAYDGIRNVTNAKKVLKAFKEDAKVIDLRA